MRNQPWRYRGESGNSWGMRVGAWTDVLHLNAGMHTRGPELVNATATGPRMQHRSMQHVSKPPCRHNDDTRTRANDYNMDSTPSKSEDRLTGGTNSCINAIKSGVVLESVPVAGTSAACALMVLNRATTLRAAAGLALPTGIAQDELAAWPRAGNPTNRTAMSI